MTGKISTEKQRNRAKPNFANINLLGRCNVDCYFCLGKDIEKELSVHNQIKVHFSKWKNFDKFLDTCRNDGIKKLYITGQNVDSLQYYFLGELIDYLKENDFGVGIRTNGFLAMQKLDIINKCTESVGYSIHSIHSKVNKLILDREYVPDWDYILTRTNKSRVSIVLNRYNQYEFLPLLEYISYFNNVGYIQVRRICTDTRFEYLKEDIEIYEKVYNYIKSLYNKKEEFYTADVFEIFGKNVNFWRTTQTTINSFNYFTDGTISKNYFIVEGYLDNYIPVA